MRELVKKQLNKCVFANLNNYDEKTHTFIIPKYTKEQYKVNRVYLIKLSKELVNNISSVIACNWNNATAPKSEYLKIFINKFNGKMAYVDTIAINPITKVDTNDYWSGWLPIDSFTLIEEL